MFFENGTYSDDNPDIEPVQSELIGHEAVRIRNIKKVFKPNGKELIHPVEGKRYIYMIRRIFL